MLIISNWQSPGLDKRIKLGRKNTFVLSPPEDLWFTWWLLCSWLAAITGFPYLLLCFLFCSFRPHICHRYHRLYPWRKICHVEKFQISVKNLNNLWSFIEIYAVFVLNLCGEKSVWRKNDKYEVCSGCLFAKQSKCGRQLQRNLKRISNKEKIPTQRSLPI